VEDIIDDIILSHFELCFDYWKTNFDLAKEINDYQSAGSVFWESGRVVDIIYEYLQSWKDLGLGDPSLESWMERFKVNRTEAARDYWQAMYAGMQDSFLKPFPEPEK
jgi:hypothetical protein